MRNLCLYSSYSGDGKLKSYVRAYLGELARHHDRVVLLSDIETLSDTDAVFLSELGVEHVACENEGYDFGMWGKAFNLIPLDAYDSLTLANDSCLLVSALDGFFAWARDGTRDCSGLSDDHQIAWHLQSFMLVFDRRVFGDVLEYFSRTGLVVEKLDVVLFYEVGLSRFLLERKRRLASYYRTVDFSRYAVDMTIYHPYRLIRKGFPLFKKSLLTRYGLSAPIRSLAARRIEHRLIAEIPKERHGIRAAAFYLAHHLLYRFFRATLLPRIEGGTP